MDSGAAGGGEAAAAAWLLTPEAVRSRAHAVLALAEADGLPYFALDLSRLDATAAYVADVVCAAYPDLRIPYHARWRHFAAGGVDRWPSLADELAPLGREEAARARVELCVVSVLLDAGAGPDWQYRERGTGLVLARSEGLAVASLHAFRAGLFAGDGRSPRVDAAGLERVDADALGRAFQVGEANPMAGLDGRAALLRRLGAALRARPDLFGAEDARIGRLFDHLAAGSTSIAARDILIALLDGLGVAWPTRTVLAGRPLGDVWPHPGLGVDDGGPPDAAGLVPFHKLSQWLAYSLVEVFEDAGIPVTGLDALTGLPEYRNGGLFLDMGVLRLRDPALAEAPLPPGHPAVVEWRALTVALLDRLASPLRARLGGDEASLPLARLLEGGTWAAGRRIAAERRPGGGPPLHITSDGTVF